MSSSVVVELAKSGHSWCRKCSMNIVKGTPRIALELRDSRGLRKWFHHTCFSFDGDTSALDIEGFDSLLDFQQDTVKRLIEEQRLEAQINATKQDGNEEQKIQEQEEVIGLEENNKVFLLFDVKKKYKDATLKSEWRAFKSVIFSEKKDGLFHSDKIAAFDFYGCLVNITGESAGRYTWSFAYESIPAKLQSLYSDGYKLAIFMNESSIDRSRLKRQAIVNSKTGMLDDFIKKVNVPIQVFIACGDGKSDPYRKPRTGMWQLMDRRFNDTRVTDNNKSFYVGDAAGRVKDHSDSDLKFAQAVGVKFYLPEKFFAVEPESRKRKAQF